jgi:hypothetical protein
VNGFFGGVAAASGVAAQQASPMYYVNLAVGLGLLLWTIKGIAETCH